MVNKYDVVNLALHFEDLQEYSEKINSIVETINRTVPIELVKMMRPSLTKVDFLASQEIAMAYYENLLEYSEKYQSEKTLRSLLLLGLVKRADLVGKSDYDQQLFISSHYDFGHSWHDILLTWHRLKKDEVIFCHYKWVWVRDIRVENSWRLPPYYDLPWDWYERIRDDEYKKYRQKEQQKARTPKQGFVYLISDKDVKGEQLDKIGYSKDPESRVKQLQINHWSSNELQIIHKIETSDTRTLEKKLHAKYQDFNIFGEWFVLTDKEVQEIMNMEGDE